MRLIAQSSDASRYEGRRNFRRFSDLVAVYFYGPVGFFDRVHANRNFKSPMEFRKKIPSIFGSL
jgi:hypothetical protein